MQFDGIHKPDVWTHSCPAHWNQPHLLSARMLVSSAALLEALSSSNRAPAGSPYASLCTGVRLRNPAGIRRKGASMPSGRQTTCKRQPPPQSPRSRGGDWEGGSTAPAECAPDRLAIASGTHPMAHWQGDALNDEHVTRSAHFSQHLQIPDHPIGELMRPTTESQDASPV
jgi:hypothetical protein